MSLINFLTGDPQQYFEQTGGLLVESNYSRLRHLFMNVVNDEKLQLQKHYQELLARYVHHGKGIFSVLLFYWLIK
jgi:hypothetical protein